MIINKYRIKYTMIGDNSYSTAAFGTDIEDAIASFKTGFVRTDSLVIDAVDFIQHTEMKRA